LTAKAVVLFFSVQCYHNKIACTYGRPAAAYTMMHDIMAL